MTLDPRTPEQAQQFLDFNFAPLCWDHASRRGGFNPALVPECKAWLARFVRGGDLQATTDGGWPRVGWGSVLDLEMRDIYRRGELVPCVLLRDRVFGGAEWHAITSITDVRGAER